MTTPHRKGREAHSAQNVSLEHIRTRERAKV